MIPKIIHYCWFGKNELSDLAIKCINSWKNNLSDYKIIEWNENNFDLESNIFVKEAYSAKKYAFVSDYVRLYVLYNYGGIYMDIDVEVIKPLDSFLENISFSGFEDYMNVPTGIIGSVKHNKIIKELLSYYDNRHFNIEGKYDLTTNVEIITDYFIKKGLIQNNKVQTIENFKFYSNITFCPSNDEVISKYINQIYTIHYKAGSWLEYKKKNDGLLYNIKKYTKMLLKNIFGKEFVEEILRKIRL